MYILDFAKNFENEVTDLFNQLKSFIVGFAMDTYNGLVDAVGKTPTDIFLIGLAAFLTCYILLKIINH